MVIGTDVLTTRDYVGQLNLHPFFNDPMNGIVGLMTLTYVPNYFDILPMYIVVLVMMPLVIAIARIHPWAAVGFCVAVYIAQWTIGFHFPAEAPRLDPTWVDRLLYNDGYIAWRERVVNREWFFNPMGWQLLFFTGFGLAVGWLKAPSRSWRLFWVCVAVLVVSLLLDYWPIYSNFRLPLFLTDLFGVEEGFRPLFEARRVINPWLNKTDFGILRYVHFLAAAYVVVHLLHGHEEKLRSPWGAPIMKCGQQSLPVFLFSMALSRYAGIALDHTGRSIPANILVNALAILSLVGIAYLLGWLKSNPWRGSKPKPAAAG